MLGRVESRSVSVPMSPASPKTAKSEEPTMEDILASIRRIIADDQAAAAEPEDEPETAQEPEDEAGGNSQAAVDDMFGDDPEPEPEPEPAGGADDDADEDVLDLGAVAEPVAKPPREPSPLDLDHEDIDFRDSDFDAEPLADPLPEPEPEPEPEPDLATFDEPAREPEPAFAEPEPFVPPPPPPEPPPRRAFDEERLLSDATDAAVGGSFNMLAHAVLTNQGRTLEDLVKEMLRPMLKDWLDDNLPTIVERLVRAEIERVSRGR